MLGRALPPADNILLKPMAMTQHEGTICELPKKSVLGAVLGFNYAAMQVHTRKLKLDADVTDDVLRQVARDLPGLSGEGMLPTPKLVLAAMCTIAPFL